MCFLICHVSSVYLSSISKFILQSINLFFGSFEAFKYFLFSSIAKLNTRGTSSSLIPIIRVIRLKGKAVILYVVPISEYYHINRSIASKVIISISLSDIQDERAARYCIQNLIELLIKLIAFRPSSIVAFPK